VKNKPTSKYSLNIDTLGLKDVEIRPDEFNETLLMDGKPIMIPGGYNGVILQSEAGMPLPQLFSSLPITGLSISETYNATEFLVTGFGIYCSEFGVGGAHLVSGASGSVIDAPLTGRLYYRNPTSSSKTVITPFSLNKLNYSRESSLTDRFLPPNTILGYDLYSGLSGLSNLSMVLFGNYFDVTPRNEDDGVVMSSGDASISFYSKFGYTGLNIEEYYTPHNFIATRFGIYAGTAGTTALDPAHSGQNWLSGRFYYRSPYSQTKTTIAQFSLNGGSISNIKTFNDFSIPWRQMVGVDIYRGLYDLRNLNVVLGGKSISSANYFKSILTTHKFKIFESGYSGQFLALSGDIQSYFASGLSSYESGINQLEQDLISGFGILSGDLTGAFDNLSGDIYDLYNNISGDLYTSYRNISGYLTGSIDAMSGDLNSLYQNISGDLYTSYANISGYLTGSIDAMSGDLYDLYQNISGDLYSSYQDISGQFILFKDAYYAFSGNMDAFSGNLNTYIIESFSGYSGATSGWITGLVSYEMENYKIGNTNFMNTTGDITGIGGILVSLSGDYWVISGGSQSNYSDITGVGSVSVINSGSYLLISGDDFCNDYSNNIINNFNKRYKVPLISGSGEIFININASGKPGDSISIYNFHSGYVNLICSSGNRFIDKDNLYVANSDLLNISINSSNLFNGVFSGLIASIRPYSNVDFFVSNNGCISHLNNNDNVSYTQISPINTISDLWLWIKPENYIDNHCIIDTSVNNLHFYKNGISGPPTRRGNFLEFSDGYDAPLSTMENAFSTQNNNTFICYGVNSSGSQMGGMSFSNGDDAGFSPSFLFTITGSPHMAVKGGNKYRAAHVRVNNILTTGSPTIISWAYSGASGSVPYIEQNGTGLSVALPYYGSYSSNENGIAKIYLGGDPLGNNGPFNGFFGDIISFNRILSSGERLTVTNYLKNKYGIA
jgi:hypothetical protein